MKAIYRLAAIIAIIVSISFGTLAYIRDYPPYAFKDGPHKHIEAELLVDSRVTEYRSRDSLVHVK